MNYDDEQVNRMIYDLQYLQIAKEATALVFIDKLLRDGEELQAVLLQYPSVRYEPLDYHYVLLKYLSVWNHELLIDLCSGHYTWRGIVSACWLTCLCPLVKSEDLLYAALATVPHENKWFVQLALAEARRTNCSSNPSLQRSVQELRRLLTKLRLPNFSLRPAPTASDIERLNVERSRILVAYRTGGHRAVERALVGTLTQQRLSAT